jgi:ABC-type nitrate/sulfonate/bicarbonate transport system substrate-binding protein
MTVFDRRCHNLLLCLVLACSCWLAATGPAFAQTIRLAVISEGTNAWPLYVAQAEGFFKGEGLQVEVTVTGSSARQLDELKKGGFDIGIQQSDHIVRAVEGGSDLFIFMAQAHAPELTLVGASDVVNIEGLRGRTVAVDGTRSGYALLLRKLLADHGLKDGDYTLREFGGSQERFDALQGGQAAASWLNPPFDQRLLSGGFRRLATTEQSFPRYPGLIGGARRSWARTHEAQLVGFIRAMDAAYAWLQDPKNRGEAMRVLPARLKIDPRAASDALDQFAKRPRPEIDADGLKQVIDVFWEAEGLPGPKGEPVKYMDLSYLQKARR